MKGNVCWSIFKNQSWFFFNQSDLLVDLETFPGQKQAVWGKLSLWHDPLDHLMFSL